MNHALANNQPADHTLEFTEPCLVFALTARAGDMVSLQAQLAYEFRPAWLDRQEQALVPLTVTHADLRLAAESLREELARFPIRSVDQ